MLNLKIPLTGGETLSVELAEGQQLYILGPNGAGKSSLMTLLSIASTNVRRVLAHRQVWLESDASNLTPTNRANILSSIHNEEQHPYIRIRDSFHSQRGGIAIYRLLEAETKRSQKIVRAVESKNSLEAEKIANEAGPLGVISQIFKLSNIPITISADGERLLATKHELTPYGVSQLSDGEKNALLLGSEVLTAAPGTVLLIDEPERHLHKSITSPLLGELFARRPDCVFIISTHSIDLALDNRNAKVLLLQDGEFADGVVQRWTAELLNDPKDIDEDFRRDILGGRSRVLFVEGSEASLDKQIYGILFPSASITAKDNCKSVEVAVTGVQSSSRLHWVTAFGIVDGDGKTAVEKDALKTKGVYALDSYSVESIYYDVDHLNKLAEKQAAITGLDSAMLVSDAIEAALSSLSGHIERLAKRIAKATVRGSIAEQAGGLGNISLMAPLAISVDAPAIFNSELTKITGMVTSKDFSGLLARYPLRETPALDVLAKKLGFPNRDNYEMAVRKLLLEDAAFLSKCRSKFGDLGNELAS